MTRLKPTIEPALLTAKQAAAYLGASQRYFETNIRPLLSFTDLRKPGARRPMPRWAPDDLDAYIRSRRVVRGEAA